MKDKSRKYILAVLALGVVLGAGFLSATVARANDSYPPFIQGLSEHFGLSETEVQNFVDEQRADRNAYKLQAFEENLQQAVDEGVITEEQMQAFLDKQEEMYAARLALKQEMDDWFESAGINKQELAPYLGQAEHHHGFR